MPVFGAEGVAAGVEGFGADDVIGLALGAPAAAIWRGIRSRGSGRLDRRSHHGYCRGHQNVRGVE